MTLKDVKSKIFKDLHDNGIQFEYTDDENHGYIKSGPYFGYFCTTKNGRFRGVILNWWYLRRLVDEGFEEEYLIENAAVWHSITKLKDFLDYFLRKKFNTAK